MNKYIEIFNGLLNDIQFEVQDLKLNTIENIDQVVEINEFSNNILSCFIDFLDSDPMKERASYNLIVIQQLKSRLIVNERKVTNLKKLATKLYLDEIEGYEDEDE
jgi:hypothetical protein